MKLSNANAACSAYTERIQPRGTGVSSITYSIRVVRESVDRSRFVRKIGIDSVRHRLTFLSADRGRDDAMGQRDGEPDHRP